MIDAHVHVFRRASKRYPREISTLYPADREAPVEQLLKVMQATGVSKAVLIQLGGLGEAYHRYLATCLKRFQGRFAGVGLVKPKGPKPEEELTELVDATAIKGIRLSYLGVPGTRDPRSLPTYGLLKQAADLGVVICLYTHGDQVGFFEPLKRELPDLQVAFDHLGVCPTNFSVDRLGRPHIETELPPPTMQAILRMARYENVHIKLSGDYAFSRQPYPYADMKPIYEALYEAFGADRLMWATDSPWILQEPGYEKLVKLIDHHLPDLTKRERAAIMGGTAARLWKLSE